MRIAIVANDLGLGGAERQAALWARECVAMGHEVVVVVLGSLGGHYELPDAIEVAALGKSHTADLPRVVPAGSDVPTRCGSRPTTSSAIHE